MKTYLLFELVYQKSFKTCYFLLLIVDLPLRTLCREDIMSTRQCLNFFPSIFQQFVGFYMKEFWPWQHHSLCKKYFCVLPTSPIIFISLKVCTAFYKIYNIQHRINDKLTDIPTCFSSFSVENLGAIGKSIGSVAPSA